MNVEKLATLVERTKGLPFVSGHEREGIDNLHGHCLAGRHGVTPKALKRHCQLIREGNNRRADAGRDVQAARAFHGERGAARAAANGGSY